ncbi:MAG: DNA gyrase subunit A, partial [Lachnospiraceae bacterium]|nr:DNA gyrase subunit A [Lachnospiraceae bacterium]
ENDEIVGMQIDTQGDDLLLATENGMGKRTHFGEFRLQNRGGKGLKCYKITDKTGELIGVKAVTDDSELLMITTAGIIIQIRMSDVSTVGRITQGVKLINLDPGMKVVKIAKVRESMEDDPSEEVLSEESDETAEAGEVQETESEETTDPDAQA